MSRRTGTLHLFALAALAFAQPLFDLLGRNGEFFVASRTGPLEILLLVGVLVLVLPTVLALVEAAAGLLGEGVWRTTHVALVVALLTIIALPMLGRIWDGRAPLVWATAALAGMAGAVAYWRFDAVRLLVSFLSIAVLIVPANFLLNSDATKFLHGNAGWARGTTVDADTPVVLLVFDELPLASLLNEELEIDAARYPNFARLASTAFWFRNATAVSDSTTHAVPAILTGRYPKEGLLPTAVDHLDNLFTLLGGSYRIEAHEPVTRLCPEDLCGGEPRGNDFGTLLADAAVVLGHAVLPSDMARHTLPPINLGWRGFAEGAGAGEPPAATRPAQTDVNWLLWHGESARFATSVAGPFPERSLRFIHLLVPHAPWRFLPSGSTYAHGTRLAFHGPEHRWVLDSSLVARAYQQHLLQVGFADRLLGQLMDDMEAAGAFDEALVIVVADHGGSFRPGDSRRFITASNRPDLVRVPLLVKLPHHTRAQRSDLPVQTIDILPTIAEVLDVTLPFDVDGQSLLSGEARRRTRVAFNKEFERFELPGGLGDLREPVHLKTALFGAGADLRRFFGRGRFWRLVGEPVERLRLASSGRLAGVLTDPDQFADVRPESGVLPVIISGRVSGLRHLANDTAAAIAVNGVIRAVSPLARFGRSSGFEVLVPEDAFRPGRNSVELFVVDATDAGVPILREVPLVTTDYRLTRASGAERLVSASGDTLLVQSGEVRGFVGAWSLESMRGRLSIGGWVVDPEHAGQPDVLVFADGRLVASVAPAFDRPDVARLFGDQRAFKSGFGVRILLADLAGVNRVRVFGVSTRGTASELEYGPGFPYGPDADHLEVANNRRVAVLPGLIKGKVEKWSRSTLEGHLTITGWAADSTAGKPATVVVFAGERLVATAAPTIGRPDIAEAMKDETLLTTGFRVQVALSELEGTDRIRVFGVSALRIASELSYPSGAPDVAAGTPTR